MKLPLSALAAFLAAPILTAAEPAVPPKISDEEIQRFKAAAAYSRAARGVSVVVMRGGEIIFEDYASIWKATKPHLLAGGTKSFCGVLAACAVQDRLITFDEKVSDTLTEWQKDSLKEQITIRQLLNLTSGLAGGDNPNAAPTFKKAVEIAEAVAEPGTQFLPGPIPFQCFGELLRRKLLSKNESVYEYLDRRLLAPIDLRVGFWRRDADDNMNMPSGAFLTALDWAKFGQLVLQRGRWEDRIVVTPATLAQCLLPGSVNPAYGLGWWRLGADHEATAVGAEHKGADRLRRELADRKQNGFHIPHDTVAALGRGGQGLYIIHSLKMVVVRMGDSEGRDFTDNEFLGLLLGKKAPK